MTVKECNIKEYKNSINLLFAIIKNDFSYFVVSECIIGFMLIVLFIMALMLHFGVFGSVFIGLCAFLTIINSVHIGKEKLSFINKLANEINSFDQKYDELDFVYRVLNSAETLEQIDTAKNLFDAWETKWS